jgi:hypothetical protein
MGRAPSSTSNPTSPYSDADLAPFVREGRLLSFPRKVARRMEVLRWLATAFEPERRYSEAEVNDLLSGHEIDFATVRRYLIDAQLLERGNGFYWLAQEVSDASVTQ